MLPSFGGSPFPVGDAQSCGRCETGKILQAVGKGHLFFFFFLPTQEFSQFFQRRYNQSVCLSDRMEFLNGWYILLVISDILTVLGTIMKIGIESKVWGRWEAKLEVFAHPGCAGAAGTGVPVLWGGDISMWQEASHTTAAPGRQQCIVCLGEAVLDVIRALTAG